MPPYYSAIIYMAIFSMVIMLFVVRNNDLLKSEKKKQFTIVFILVICAAAAEWGCIRLNGTSEYLRVPHILIKALELSVAPFIPVAFTRVITSNRKMIRWVVLLCIHALFEVISGFCGFIYYIDENNVYQHGRFYAIYVFVYIFFCILAIVECMRFGQRYQNNNRLILALALIYLVSGVVIGMLNSQIKTDYICVSIDVILMYIFYTEIIEKTDALTSLLNRRSYEGCLSSLQEKVAILNFDIDNFKEINDTYGHAFGDESLRIVGKTIQTAYARYGSCYRIGGDEFCVILYNRRMEIEQMNRSFFQLIEQERKKEPRIPFVSVGYALFDPHENDLESVLEEADQMMYRVKKMHKQK